MTRYEEVLAGLPDDLTEDDVIIDRTILDAEAGGRELPGLLLELLLVRGARSVQLRSVTDEERVRFADWAVEHNVSDRVKVFDS